MVELHTPHLLSFKLCSWLCWMSVARDLSQCVQPCQTWWCAHTRAMISATCATAVCDAWHSRSAQLHPFCSVLVACGTLKRCQGFKELAQPVLPGGSEKCWQWALPRPRALLPFLTRAGAARV